MDGVAIILAAGSGSRFAGSGIQENMNIASDALNVNIPKQFHLLASKPILRYSIDAFAQVSFIKKLVLVMPIGWDKKKFISYLDFDVSALFSEVTFINGGKTRQLSVASALKILVKTSQNSIVFIHDRVRPFIGKKDIYSLYEAAKKNYSATLSMDITETICNIENRVYLDRDKLRTIQTPQAFHPELWHKLPVLLENIELVFTDETMAASHLNYKTQYIDSNPFNRKITRYKDLKIMEALLSVFEKEELNV